MTNCTSRQLLMVTALAVVLTSLGLQFRSLLADPSILPPDDFVEYWAAGHLNTRGENPYDPDKLLPLERSAGRATEEAVMMWNPPWTLAIAMPFGLLEPRISQLLWLLLGLVFVGLGADWLWRIYEGPQEKRWLAWVLAFTFVPTFFVLGAGQIGTWVLLGAVAFLGLVRTATPRAAMGTGAATVLLAVKPHLVYLFWIALIVWAFRRDRRVLLGGLIAGVLATGAALACNPRVIHQYWEAMTQRPPAQWKSPTLGTWLRMIEGEARFGLQFVPAVLGIGWLVWHVWRTRERDWYWTEQMPILLLVSFVTASYGAWPFDLVILLPAVIAIAASIAKDPNRKRVTIAIIFWMAINVAALIMNLLKVGSEWFIWMAPSILAAYLLFGPARWNCNRAEQVNP